MVVSLHVATGGLVGALAGSRPRALVLGLVAHAVGDAIPHQDVSSRTFETLSGVACLGVLAAAHGPASPVVLGAIGGSSPDLEHVIRLARPGGRKLFPSHRVRGWHRSGGLPASLQLLAAGAIVGALAAGRLYGRVGR
ncbi:MAG TPA: hypothetical protein VD704_11555 [Gaiellaceae bacterium]|nr:hypothetical protein [Gaiellaceae bacterium]